MLEHKEHQLELLIIRHSRPGFPFNFEAEYQAGNAVQNNQEDDGNPNCQCIVPPCYFLNLMPLPTQTIMMGCLCLAVLCLCMKRISIPGSWMK